MNSMFATKHKMNDASRIEMIKSKDRSQRSRALEDIYVSYYAVFEKFVLSRNGNKEEAKDVFQDGITVLYTKIMDEKFRGESKIKTYLFSICRNLYFQHIKKKQKENLMKQNQKTTEVHPETNVAQKDKVFAVFQVFNTLGKDCQKILELFYFEKLSMSEIAAEFGYKGEQSAKNKKSRCLKKLRSLIEAEPSVYAYFDK